MFKLNILILHCLGNPKLAPRFLFSHVYSLKIHNPENNYLYHDATLPLPDYIKELDFHVIIFDVTFLAARWAGTEYFSKRLNDYRFVKDKAAIKIAFPQDEYDCNILLDKWMCDWEVDVVVSVIASHHDVLYPNYHKYGEIELGYTAYLDEELLKKEIKPFNNRKIDIGYRARNLLPYFGRIGENKSSIGFKVKALAINAGLKTDIIIGQSGELLGEKWINFINECKFTLGANSGSSLLDPVGDIQKKVRSYLNENPNADFKEVEINCFPGMDGHFEFTAISPRVIEAAVLNSCQILVEGDYSNIIQPWIDYLPLKPDASNFSSLLDAMSDQALIDSMIKNCRDKIINSPHLKQSNNAAKILNLAKKKINSKNVYSNNNIIEKNLNRYKTEMDERYKRAWKIQGLKHKAKENLRESPKIYSFLKSIQNIIR